MNSSAGTARLGNRAARTFDLSAFYTKTEMDTRFEQTSAAIALKADKTEITYAFTRIEQAEQKVTPQAITSA